MPTLLLNYMPTDFLRMSWSWFLVTCETIGKDGRLQGSVLGPIFFNIYLNVLFYFLRCDVCNFADDTTSYVCGNNLDFVFTELEEHLNGLRIIIEWIQITITFLSWETNLNFCGLT